MIDLAQMVYQIATAGMAHDPERCKTCTYRDDPRDLGYCYMFFETPKSLCHHYREDQWTTPNK